MESEEVQDRKPEGETRGPRHTKMNREKGDGTNRGSQRREAKDGGIEDEEKEFEYRRTANKQTSRQTMEE